LVKIAFVVDWWKPDLVGGAERTLHAAAIRLIESGFDVHVVTLRNPDTNFKHNEKVKFWDGVSVTYVKSMTLRSATNKSLFIKLFERVRLFVDLVTPVRVAKAVRQIQPECIIYGPLDRLGPRTIRRVSNSINAPSIRSFHDFSDLCVLRSRYRAGKNCENTCIGCVPRARSYVKAAFRHESRIYVSNFVSRKFIAHGHPRNGGKVGYPTLLGERLPKDFSNSGNSAPNAIGYVGRMHPTKGIELAILAASVNPKLKLILKGHGAPSYIDELRNLASELEVELTILPFSANPYEELLSKVRLLVVPSVWEEPFGRIPIEAAQYGLPCVVADIGGLPESASQISPPSPLFTPGDYLDLRKAIDSTPSYARVTNLPCLNEFPNVVLQSVMEALDYQSL